MTMHSVITLARCRAWLLALGLISLLNASLAALELNTANEAELDGLRGLGPSSTALILESRASAPFIDWADFMRRVKGIKDQKAADLSKQGLRINSLAFTKTNPP